MCVMRILNLLLILVFYNVIVQERRAAGMIKLKAIEMTETGIPKAIAIILVLWIFAAGALTGVIS